MTNDTTDLQARLREAAEYFRKWDVPNSGLVDEAADEIARLTDTVERLEKYRNHRKEGCICTFAEDGETLAKECYLHADARRKADALAEAAQTVTDKWDKRHGKAPFDRVDFPEIENLLSKLTDYQGDGK